LTAKKDLWKGFPGAYEERCLQRLWRNHSDAVNRALLIRWLSERQRENFLKTDLFDEAVSDGLSPLLNARAKKIFYIDTSFEVHQMARSHRPRLQTIRTDVRRLPFSNGTFDGIVSNSTLDHFESADEIVTSLQELYRVLRPGGELILTLDNLANPIILLRNGLPFHWLYRMKIVPYYVGRTLRPRRLQPLLGEIGFKILEVDAILHCPRVLAVAMARWMERYASPKTQRSFLRFLMTFEHLSHLPTRFFTGHFIAVRAMKH
jgi:SAM-dependent methyltransferase